MKKTKIRLVIWETHLKPNLLTKKQLSECYDKLSMQGFSCLEKVGNVEAWGRST